MKSRLLLLITVFSLLLFASRVRAQSPSCFYHAEAVVIKEDKSYLTNEENGSENWGVSNENQLAKSPGIVSGLFGRFDDNNNNINRYFDNKAIYVYHHDDQNFGPDEKKPVSVSLIGLDRTKWDIVGQFCDQLGSSTVGCPSDIEPNSTTPTISGFVPQCGVNVKYGWIVKPANKSDDNNDDSKSCQLSQTECAPQNIQVEFRSKNRFRTKWTNPTQCAGLILNNHMVAVDIQDSSGEIVCSKDVQVDSVDLSTDCKLGRDTIRNTASINQFESGEEYTAYVRTTTKDKSCQSPANSSKKDFVKPTDTPKPSPENTPTSAMPSKTDDLVCPVKGASCTDRDYTEECITPGGEKGKKTCTKVGICMGVGDGSRCSWDPTKSSCGSCIGESGNEDDNRTDSTACKHIIGTGSTRVLFIPYQFNSTAQFAPYTSQAIANIRATNLGGLYNNFSFIAYNKFSGSYGCREGIPFPGGTMFGCDNQTQVREAMSECKANAALVIANVPGYGGYSVQGSKIASLKTGTITYSAHELGHAIAGLDDEYSYNNTTKRTNAGPNCSPNNSCSWVARHLGSGCIPVCGFTNWYRSSQKSVMNKDGNKNNEWNAVSLDAWGQNMKYSTRAFQGALALASSVAEYNTALSLDLRQNQRGELSVEDMNIITDYPIDLDSNLPKDYFTVKMIDSKQIVLYTGQFASRNVQISESGGQQEVIREQIALKLPYYKDLYSVEIYDENNQKKLDIDLDEYDLVEPTPAVNLCGNGVCDSEKNETQNSCSQDCKPDNDYRNNYKELSSDINQDGQVNILDCTVCLQQYKKLSPQVSCDIINDTKIDALDYSACLNNLGKATGNTNGPVL